VSSAVPRSPLTDALDLVASPYTQGRVTRTRTHRPWPMPRRPWVMGQTWIDLLFAHWSVEPDELDVPAQIPLDLRDGRAWIAVTPFAVRNLRARLTFPVPVLSAFPELNVRTYVTYGGKPGIYFFSLDAGSGLAVAAARRLYRLPYFHARMAIDRVGGEVRYASERDDARFRGWYRPVGAPFQPAPGTLEHWLIERYCLYTLDDRGRVLRAQIHHPPWRLRAAEAEIEENTMAHGLHGAPLLHHAARQDVVLWGLEAG
jgi:uncharacterized protein YqjF (DUF2071 family)